MASANVPVENPFLTQIERVRVELRERVARAHQVLQERETALLSELQQLEDVYRGEGVGKQIDQLRITKGQNIATLTDNENQEFLEQSVALLDTRMRELEASLETARDRMRGVELEWDTNLERMLSGTGSIRVRGVADYKEKGNPIKVAGKHLKTREHVTEGSPSKNLGNTDYMNSILQCLSHTFPLRQFYVSDEYKQYLNNNRGNLSNEFKYVMLKLWNTNSEYSVAPYYLKRQVGIAAPLFSDYSQHDAHEFMRFLLNELHEEINRASEEGRKSPADSETLGEACARYLTWEDSRISQLFSGMLRSDVCCSLCYNQSTAYIPFMDLSLPIPERKHWSKLLTFISPDPNVQFADCLTMLLTEEILDNEERPYCNNCNQLTRSNKQLSIAKLPRFLVIQLKRFSGVIGCAKRSTHIEFDDTLILEDKINTITYTYSLYGIVCHSGSTTGGHYTAYCKYNRNWRSFNDTITKSVHWEQVRQQEAYILLYEDNSIL